jgi:CBS domain-containing protein
MVEEWSALHHDKGTLVIDSAALLIRHVPSATGGVLSVRSDQSLAAAQSKMSAHDYSQLAVLAGPCDLKGAVSLRSIMRARFANAEVTLADATYRPKVVHSDDELLSQFDVIYNADFVLVKGADARVCGIVTTADLTAQVRDLTTSFLQLDEIEKRLRRCIDRAFRPEELRAATGNKKLESAHGMDFGQYVRLLSDEGRWHRMGWPEADLMTFISYLEAARVVRNRVMHFGEALNPADKSKLEHFFNFVRALDPLP